MAALTGRIYGTAILLSSLLIFWVPKHYPQIFKEFPMTRLATLHRLAPFWIVGVTQNATQSMYRCHCYWLGLSLGFPGCNPWENVGGRDCWQHFWFSLEAACQHNATMCSLPPALQAQAGKQPGCQEVSCCSYNSNWASPYTNHIPLDRACKGEKILSRTNQDGIQSCACMLC